MTTVVEKSIPGYPGFYARTDGLIRGPTGILTSYPANQQGHQQVWVKKGNWYRRNSVLVHRLLAFTFVHNPRPDIFKTVDHINHNPYDNRVTNLRWVNTQLNALNSYAAWGVYWAAAADKDEQKKEEQKKIKESESGIIDVPSKGMWGARLTLNHQTRHLGFFKTCYWARTAYKLAKQQAFNRIYRQLTNEAPPTGSDFFWI